VPQAWDLGGSDPTEAFMDETAQYEASRAQPPDVTTTVWVPTRDLGIGRAPHLHQSPYLTLSI